MESIIWCWRFCVAKRCESEMRSLSSSVVKLARESMEPYSEDVTGRESSELEMEERAEMDELKEELDLASDPLLGPARKGVSTPVRGSYNTSRVSPPSALSIRREMLISSEMRSDENHNLQRPFHRSTPHHNPPPSTLAALERAFRPFPLFDTRIFQPRSRNQRTQSTPFLRLLLRYSVRKGRYG